MSRYHLAPSLESFDSLIKIFGHFKRMDLVKRTLRRMQNKGVAPTIGTINNLIIATANCEGIDAAFALMDDIERMPEKCKFYY